MALRSGELTPSVQKNMPFANLQEAFDQVEALAKEGDAFCQYIIGNSYFWWDFLRIQNKGKDSFPSQAEFKAYLKGEISKCEDWFWKAFRGGMYLAANNLNRYYTIYAEELRKAERYGESLRWFKESAEANNGESWYKVAWFYSEGKGVEKDGAYAASCCEKELSRNPRHRGANNLLGQAYLHGDGVPQDYAKAYQHLIAAFDAKNCNWGAFYLAQCAFNGWGTPQDYGKALQFLNAVDWQNREAAGSTSFADRGP